MKKSLIILAIVLLIVGLAMQAQATLQNLGVDSLGNRLIYDNGLDITWYDFTNSFNTWQDQVGWANSLSVTFGTFTYDDWRLPTTVDGPYQAGIDGTTTAGLNITSSEMGHLYYTELGNKADYDTSGNYQSDWGLLNTGVFQNLQGTEYWSGTAISTETNRSWYFDTRYGSQYTLSDNISLKGIAVRPGLAVAPEPVSSTLFILGGATLGFRRFRKKIMQ